MALLNAVTIINQIVPNKALHALQPEHKHITTTDVLLCIVMCCTGHDTTTTASGVQLGEFWVGFRLDYVRVCVCACVL